MVQVPECLEETCDNYVVMQHGSHYSLKLSNHHKDGGRSKPCDADVFLDGKLVGSWRIPYGQNIVIERPADDSGKFTAYKKGSVEAAQAQIDSGSSDLGLIKVVFRPGTKKVAASSWPYTPYTPYIPKVEPWGNPLGGVYAYAVTNWDAQQGSCQTFSNNLSGINSSDNVVYRGLSGDGVQISHSISNNSSLVGGGTGLSGESNQRFTETEELSYDEPVTTIHLRLAFRDNDEPRPLREARKVYSTSVPRLL